MPNEWLVTWAQVTGRPGVPEGIVRNQDVTDDNWWSAQKLRGTPETCCNQFKYLTRLVREGYAVKDLTIAESNIPIPSYTDRTAEVLLQLEAEANPVADPVIPPIIEVPIDPTDVEIEAAKKPVITEEVNINGLASV